MTSFASFEHAKDLATLGASFTFSRQYQFGPRSKAHGRALLANENSSNPQHTEVRQVTESRMN